MIVNPERVAFSTKEDVIDYVARGIPPTKKNFTKVMAKVYCPTREGEGRKGQEVIIPEDVFTTAEVGIFADVMERVYKDRVHNRNVIIGVGCLIAVAGIVVCSSKSKKDDPVTSEPVIHHNSNFCVDIDNCESKEVNID